MLEKLKEKLRMLTRLPVPFDPARFADPLALQVEWTPAKRGGSSFRTHKLIAVGPNRVEFRAAIGAVFFYLLFFVLGLGVFVVLVASRFSERGVWSDPGMLVPAFISLVFIVLGAVMLYTGTTPLVFEKGRGIFWKGRKGSDEAIDNRSTRTFVRLDQVHAIQLIAEYISGKNSYYSYELNLVLEDRSRVTVIDHGNLNRIREDARTLGLFLGKPVWDATKQVKSPEFRNAEWGLRN